MRSPVQRLYGAGPGHLLMMLVCLALAGAAAALVAGDPAWPVMLVWFLAAVLLHDLVLFPLYTAADRAFQAVVPRQRRVPVINHVRVPLLGAGLTFLLFLPGIIRQGGPTLRGRVRPRPVPVPGAVAAAGGRDGARLSAGVRRAGAADPVTTP